MLVNGHSKPEDMLALMRLRTEVAQQRSASRIRHRFPQN